MQDFIQQMVNGLSLGAIYALVAVGYTMVYGILRLINFAHGEVFMVGAMFAFYAATRWFRTDPAPADLAAWHWALAGVGGAAVVAAARRALGGAVAFAGDGATAGAGRRTATFLLCWAAATAGLEWAVGRTFFADIAPWGSLAFSVVLGVPAALLGRMILGWVLTRRAALPALVGLFAAVGVAYAARRWFRPADHSWLGFTAILVTAMAGSAVVGLVIEFCAYRPLRTQPRINALITAIGVSLFLQFAGQTIFFGNDPKTFPDTAIPRLLPGTPESPDTLLPWSARSVLRFGDPAPAAPAPAHFGVELEGAGVRVWWVAGPAELPPATAPSDVAPAAATATVPTTAPTAPTRVARAPGVESHVQVNAMLVLILLLTLVLMVALRHVVLHTRTGLGLRAVSHRFDTAALMGVNINRTVSFTFVLGSALAGAAGCLYAGAYQRVEPLMGLGLGLAAFVAAVVGGIGSIPGAVAGGFLLGVVQTLVAGFLENGSRYSTGVAYVILILVLMVRPAGLFGRSAPEKV